jgi:endonuclease-3 related protein
VKRKGLLLDLYDRLYDHFGPRHWWPGESPFEVAVGAILTQNTAWRNVEKAIANLKANALLSPRALQRLTVEDLAKLIKPAGYYNIKAKRLNHFLDFLFLNCRGDIGFLSTGDLNARRNELLQVNGIGPETADSILLYAANRPTFVVDAYTRRILSRHQLIPEKAVYDEIRDFFMNALDPDVDMFNEFHALLVYLGKGFCKKKSAACSGCPAEEWPRG